MAIAMAMTMAMAKAAATVYDSMARASSYGARARLHKPAACLLTVAYQGVRTVGRCCGKYTSVCVCVCVSHKLTAKLLKFYATLL